MVFGKLQLSVICKNPKVDGAGRGGFLGDGFVFVRSGEAL
jgi:hypothetical protein